MALTDHSQLEIWVGTLTAIVAAGGAGWIAYAKGQRDDILEKISNVVKDVNENKQEAHMVWEKQWQRLDEIKDNSATKKELEDQWARSYETLHRTAFKEDLEAVRKRTDDLKENYVSRSEFKDELRSTVTLAITPLKISLDILATQVANLATQVAKNGGK